MENMDLENAKSRYAQLKKERLECFEATDGALVPKDAGRVDEIGTELEILKESFPAFLAPYTSFCRAESSCQTDSSPLGV